MKLAKKYLKFVVNFINKDFILLKKCLIVVLWVSIFDKMGIEKSAEDSK